MSYSLLCVALLLQLHLFLQSADASLYLPLVLLYLAQERVLAVLWVLERCRMVSK